jgi:hypothetical protein
MNFFKKALVASAVVASFGASAATLSSDPLKMSAEGVSIGNTADDQELTFDVVVNVLHPASSTITLTFDKNFEVSTLAAAAGGVVTNTVGTGTGVSGDISFYYGTGSFTFDNVVITNGDATKGEVDSISFDVNLGNPVTADSAFRIILDGAGAIGDGAGLVDLAGASVVSYSSVTSTDVAIETGTGVISTEVSQFAFGVKTPWNGVIERVSQVTFAENGDVATPADADTLVLTAINDESLAANVAAVGLSVVLDGNFDNGGTALANTEFDVANTNAQRTAAVFGTAPALDTVDFEDLTLTIANAEIGTGSTDDELTVVFDGLTKVIPQTGDIEATATFAAGTDKWTYTESAGEWKLDATIINVPYLPVGKEGTSSSVHFANESSSDVDVIVSAIDADGNVYAAVDLGKDFAKKTVTKVSQAELIALFDLPTDSLTKLSVTFNIDADKGDVNGYAFTTDDTGRTEISTSQQRGN